jgi:hypothetical protein
MAMTLTVTQREKEWLSRFPVGQAVRYTLAHRLHHGLKDRVTGLPKPMPSTGEGFVVAVNLRNGMVPAVVVGDSPEASGRILYSIMADLIEPTAVPPGGGVAA